MINYLEYKRELERIRASPIKGEEYSRRLIVSLESPTNT